MNDLLADVDTVIAIYFLDFVNRDDVGAMHSQKLFLWQHLHSLSTLMKIVLGC